MSDAVMVALITGLCGVLGQWLISRSSNKKAAKQLAEKEAEKAAEDARWKENVTLRLSSVEHKLDVHNGYAKTFSEIQRSISVIENDIKTLYKKGA